MRVCIKIFFAFVFPLCLKAQAFKSDYVSFDLPKTWTCKQFGTSYVCHDKFQQKKVEALITVTAKIAGSFDTHENYLKHLQEEKIWSTKKGEEITSKKLSEAKYIYPNKYIWVDSIHKNSEVKSYISRYAGTVCCENSSSKLGILLVLSAHEDHWKKYASIFLTAINSLKVLDIEKAVSKVRAEEALEAGAGMDGYLEGLLGEDTDPLMDEEGGGLLSDPMNLMLLIAAGVAVLILLIIKLKKKRSSLKRRRRRRRRK